MTEASAMPSYPWQSGYANAAPAFTPAQVTAGYEPFFICCSGRNSTHIKPLTTALSFQTSIAMAIRKLKCTSIFQNL